jgi:hypothetical protein
MAGLTGIMPMQGMPGVGGPSFDPPSSGVPSAHDPLQQRKLKIIIAVVVGLFLAPFCFGIVFQIVIMLIAGLGIAAGGIAAGHAP